MSCVIYMPTCERYPCYFDDEYNTSEYKIIEVY